MANQEHVDMLLRDGVETWNRWRSEHQDVVPDLGGADLFGADIFGADLHGANLVGAELAGVNLGGANLGGANLSGADLSGADLLSARLAGTDFRGADLRKANFRGAYLGWATFVGARLSEVNLTEVICVRTDFSGATLTGCNVYGISAWDVNLEGTVQADLHIKPWEHEESLITVDNLEVAQFLYLLLHNENMRAVLDTITSKVVLILGRFSDERKPVLDALREALRSHPNGYIPVLFDFEPQTDRPVLETVKTLANLSRFVIADLTDPHMVRAELTAIVPNVPTVPVQPIVQGDAALPTEHESWALYRSVLPVYRHADLPHLLAHLTDSVISPVEAHVQARRL